VVLGWVLVLVVVGGDDDEIVFGCEFEYLFVVGVEELGLVFFEVVYVFVVYDVF